MAGTKRGWLAAVLVLCVMSLAGFAPVRAIEQFASHALGALEGVLSEWMPSEAVERDPQATARARDAHAAYLESVSGAFDPADTDGDGAGLLVPVVSRSPDRYELVLRVPAGAVAVGAPVAHRGVLLGFVHRLGEDDTRATVALLGHSAARPVAGEWKASEAARPVWFLVRGREGDMHVSGRSSTVGPRPDQLAWTRDVGRLGDDLPPGLVLGRVVTGTRDAPGGGLVDDPDTEVRLQPVLDPYDVDVVGVQAKPGHALSTRTVGAALSRTSRAPGRWRVDVGTTSGVRTGDWVIQDGVFVGVIVVAGRSSSEVVDRVPAGLALVIDDSGGADEVVPCTPDVAGWPDDWRPRSGQLVAGGHLAYGGFLLGEVGAVGDDGWRLIRSRIDPHRAVTIVEP